MKPARWPCDTPAAPAHGSTGELDRNRLWLPRLRLPLRVAWDESGQVPGEAETLGIAQAVRLQALRGLPWLIAKRRRVPGTRPA